MQNKAIFLMGPTAAGKTAVSLQVARRFPVDIISVDSAMVYRGMDIGTGKPTIDEQLVAPHRLIDICEPCETYSVAQFCTDALQAMHTSWQQQRVPLLVGGTMLYFKALQFGLSELPVADPILRAQINAEGDMHKRLQQIDPESAARLNPNDQQRLQRALEINLITGKTLAENYAASNSKPLPCEVHSFAIFPDDRVVLHKNIAARFDAMLHTGLVPEVEALHKRGDLNINLPSIRSVGYKQVWNYLAQKISYNEMREQAIAATRQLAKRQYTWLRNWPAAINFTNNPQQTLDSISNSMIHSIAV